MYNLEASLEANKFYRGMEMNRQLLKVLLGVLILAACQGKATPSAALQATQVPTSMAMEITQATDVYGVWILTSHPHFKPAYFLLRPDGSFTFSSNPDGGTPSESGKYWFENNQFMISDDFCPTPGKYSVMKQGEPGTSWLTFTLLEDGCTARMKILTGGVATWFGVMK